MEIVGFESMTLTVNDVYFIISHLTKATKKLDLIDCQIDSSFLIKLEEHLSCYPKLTILNLSHNSPSIIAECSIVRNYTNILTSLNLSHNDLFDIFDLSMSLVNNNTLTHLDLSHNKIGSDGCLQLAVMLTNNSCLSVLNVSHNPIFTSGVCHLAFGLKHNTILKELNLSQCYICDKNSYMPYVKDMMLFNDSCQALYLPQDNICDELITES